MSWIRSELVWVMVLLSTGCSRDLEELVTAADFNCADGLQNGDETDTDCGGSCDACPDLSFCVDAVDCESSVCTLGVCQAAACDDGVRNGDETDIDCGSACDPCTDESACVFDSDCDSLLCLPETNTCAVLFDGDLIVIDFSESSLDGDLVTLLNSDVISGDVSFNDPLTAAIPTIRAREIRGNLNVIGNTQLTSIVGLSALTEIEGDMRVSGNASLTDLSGLAVTRVGGELALRQNSSLTSLTGLEALTEVGSLSLTDNPTLVDLSALNGSDGTSGLQDVVGALEIIGNRSLTAINGFDALLTAGAITISDNDELALIDGGAATLDDPGAFAQLSDVSEGITISGNRNLTRVFGFDFLVTTGSIVITDNSSLQEILGFFELLSVDAGLIISVNPSLETVDGFDVLSIALGGMQFLNLDELQTLPAFDQLTVVAGSAGLSFNQLGPDYETVDGFAQLDLLSNLTVSNTFISEFRGFGSLREIDGALVVADNPDLMAFSGAMGGIDFDRVPVRGEISVSRNTSLTSVSFAGTQAMRGTIAFTENPALSTISFPNLTRAVGFGILSSGPVLNVSFPLLTELRENRPGLEPELRFGTLTDGFEGLSGFIQIGSASGSVYDFPQLQRVGALLFAIESGGATLNTPALTRVDRAFALTSTSAGNLVASFPELLQVGGDVLAADSTGCEASFCVSSEPLANTTFALPKLQRVDGNIRLSITNLVSFSAPALTSVGGLELGGNSAMTTLNLPLLANASSGQGSADISLNGNELLCVQNLGACTTACDTGTMNACAPNGCEVLMTCP
ncbi:MAG: hypothetical protein AAF658_02770 [Myxococcota bacterium]